MENPRFVETFTYSVIVATIILQGLTAAPIARLLKLRPPERTGWLIVGAHAFGRRIARFLKNQGERDVILLDSNAGTVRQAVAENLDARMRLALDEARRCGLQLPGLAMAEQMYRKLAEMGHARAGTQALIKVLEDMNRDALR